MQVRIALTAAHGLGHVKPALPEDQRVCKRRSYLKYEKITQLEWIFQGLSGRAISISRGALPEMSNVTGIPVSMLCLWKIASQANPRWRPSSYAYALAKGNLC
jgi:hypothetical protein